MRDVVIPESLQDAMSREAQAAREKEARIILGQAEVEIAHLFEQASQVLRGEPHGPAPPGHEHPLRGPEGEGPLMLIPSTAVESMGLGGMLGAAALRQQTLSHGGHAPSADNGPVV